MKFVLTLSEGREGHVFCGGNRMHEGTIRSSLSDPCIGIAEGPCIIAFVAKRVGDRPLQAEVVKISDVNWIGRRHSGDIALFLKDGRLATITVAPENFEAARQVFAEFLKSAPSQDGRFFFATVEGKLALVNTADIRKRTKTPRPDRRSQPSMTER